MPVADVAQLAEVAALMARHRLARVRLPDGTELEMSPLGFTAPAAVDGAPPAIEPDDAERCSCGHGLIDEHTEAGCLRGCSDAACMPPAPGGAP